MARILFPPTFRFFYFLIKIQIFWLIWCYSFSIIIVSFSFLFPFITSFIKNFSFSLIPPFSFSSFFDLLPLLCTGNLVYFLSFLIFCMSRLCFMFSSMFSLDFLYVAFHYFVIFVVYFVLLVFLYVDFVFFSFSSCSSLF